MVLSSITVFLMLVLIDRMVNGTLYNFGLTFNPQWSHPYQIYFYAGIGLIFLNAVAAGLLLTTYPRQKEQKSEKDNPSKAEESTSTLGAPSPSQITEQKTETKLQTPKTAALKPSRVRCRYCDFENEPDSVFCEGCGKLLGNAKPSVPTTHVYCRYCGTKNRGTAEYCKKCGKPINQ